MNDGNSDEYLNGADPPVTESPPGSTNVAEQAGVSWTQLSATLAPVLGDSGVTAIFRRALESAETEHPWLDEVRERTRSPDPFTPLLASLSRCSPDTAAAAQAYLLEQFGQKLSALTGEPLAQRLLAMVRAREDDANFPPPRPDEIAAQLILTALRAEADGRLARCERDQARLTSEQDDLTGVANRTRMLDRLTSAIALANRTGTPTAVLFIDLDRFKQINDGMGHRAGDDMLREVATRLQDVVRQTDTVCRYGGDEFVVILTPMERRSEAAPAVARILQSIAGIRGPDPAVPALSASIGIGLYPEHGTTPEALLNRADRSMYRHKCGQRDPLPGAQEESPQDPARDFPLWPGADGARVSCRPFATTIIGEE